MSAKSNQTPKPIIDNLEHLENPFYIRHFDAKPFLLSEVSNADTDLEFVLKFLYSYNGSTATFNSYRRELERLLQWSWNIERLSILDLRREHIEEFVRFCVEPPSNWIGTKNVARYKNKNGLRVANPEWRPFVAVNSKVAFRDGHSRDVKDFKLSQSAIKAIFTATSSFYDYLIQAFPKQNLFFTHSK